MRLIVAEVFLSQLSQLTASPLSAPGTIDIQARITDLTSDLTRLPESGPIAGALLGASCAARLSGGAISSLVVAGREGLPPDPAGALPSPLIPDGGLARPPLAHVSRSLTAKRKRFSLLAADRPCSGFRPL